MPVCVAGQEQLVNKEEDKKRKALPYGWALALRSVIEPSLTVGLLPLHLRRLGADEGKVERR